MEILSGKMNWEPPELQKRGKRLHPQSQQSASAVHELRKEKSNCETVKGNTREKPGLMVNKRASVFCPGEEKNQPPDALNTNWQEHITAL